MSYKDIVGRLKQVRLFQDLKQNELNAIAKLVSRQRFREGELICEQGRPGHLMYFVESGELTVHHVDPHGIEHQVDVMTGGDYFGETSLLLGEPRDATVRVAQEATLLSIDRNDFKPLLKEQPSILSNLNMRQDVADKYYAKTFKGQKLEEIVIISENKHIAILIKNLIFPLFVLGVVIGGSSYWLSLTGWSIISLAISGLLLFLPLIFIVYLLVDQLNDNYIVTNRRVLHIEEVPFVIEVRVEAMLDDIQDIQQLQEGPLAHWLNYGNLVIETAGETGHVVFRDIPNPSKTREEIFRQRDRTKSWVKARERAAIRGDLREHFGLYMPEGELAESQLSSDEKKRRWFKSPAWLDTLLQTLSFFSPRLRSEQGDTITWRKHWIALVKPISLPTLCIFIVTSIAFFLFRFSSLDGTLILIFYGATIVILFPWWLWVFDDWQNDIYQVTSTRVIDVERLPFYLREERREANLGSIQNVSLEIPGILGKLLNFGSVKIETAASGAFTFLYVKDPHAVQAEIFRRKQAYEARLRQEEMRRHRNELLDWFAVYDQFRRKTPDEEGLSPRPMPPVTPSQQEDQT